MSEEINTDRAIDGITSGDKEPRKSGVTLGRDQSDPRIPRYSARNSVIGGVAEFVKIPPWI